MKRSFATLLLIACIFVTALSQSGSNAYGKAIEALQNNDFTAAFPLLEEEIKNNPDNGYAHYYLSVIKDANGDIDGSLESAKMALEKIPANDEHFKALAYANVAILQNLKGDFDNALININKALEIEGTNPLFFEDRATFYYGRHMHSEAADDAISALAITDSQKAFDVLLDMTPANFDMIVSKIQKRSEYSATNFRWHKFLGLIHEGNYKYADAAEYYLIAFERSKSVAFLRKAVMCFFKSDKFNEALEAVDKAIELEHKAADIAMKASIYSLVDRNDLAVSNISQYIEQIPESVYGYDARGFYRSRMRDYVNAISDFSKAIELETDNFLSYVGRGRAYAALGENDKAKADYEFVLSHADNNSEDRQIAYAAALSGNRERLEDYLGGMINSGKVDAGLYYTAACAYSILGDKAEALKLLQYAIQAGLTTLSKIKYDEDLDNIRDTEEYRKIAQTYDF